MQDARDNPNPHYIKDMEAKVPQRGCKSLPSETSLRVEMFEHRAYNLARAFADETPLSEEDGLSYNGWIANFSRLQFEVSVPEWLRKQVSDSPGELRVDDYYDPLKHEVQVHERLGRNEGIIPPTCPSEYRIGVAFAKENNLECYLGSHPEREESFKIIWILSLTNTLSYVRSRRVL